MTPWETIRATAGTLGVVYLHMVMGADPHINEGGATLPEGRWAEYHPTKGVRVYSLGDRSDTPYTSWKRIEQALRDRVNPDPLRPAWDTYRTAWRAYLDVNDQWLDRYQRETVSPELQEQVTATHSAQFHALQSALTQLRAALAADEEPADLLDLLGSMGAAS